VVVCVLNNGQHTTGILDLHGGGGRKEGRKETNIRNEREREREGFFNFSLTLTSPSFVFFAENKSLR
jgi:hypothetical protein